MADNNIIFNGDPFVENLDNLLQFEKVNFTTTNPTDLNATASLNSAQVMINQYNSSGIGHAGLIRSGYFLNLISPTVGGLYKVPDSDSFFSEFGNNVNFINPANNATTVATNVLNAFVDDYREILGIGASGSPPSGDWSELLAGVQNLYPSGTSLLDSNTQAVIKVNDITDADIITQFKNAFTHFLNTYPFLGADGQPLLDPNSGHFVVNPNVGYVGNPTLTGDAAKSVSAFENFFKNWLNYMTSTANVSDTTAGTASATVTGLDSYKQLYLSYGFPAADFSKRLAQFYESELKESGYGDVSKGYFIPSQSFNKWFETMRDEYLKANIVSSVDGGFIENGSAANLLVLDRILRLLSSLVGVLQQVSAAQANRLTFLSKWQEAYTKLVADVPTFTQGDGTILGQSGNNFDKLRTEVNSKMNSLLEKLKAYRSNVQDEAKALQTTLNQSQDASNQQAQMASSILNQLSTILSQIFK